MKRTYSNGYIGLLALIIGTAIIIFLAAKQYEKIGQRRQNTLQQENMENGDTSTYVHPIDKALDVKAQVEARDRAIMGQ